VFIKKQPLPLIVVKKDGGFNYDTTDLAAVRHRLVELKADRVIYITDLGQQQHFHLVFAGAELAGWKTAQRLDHMGFGLVLGEDGKKFSSRKADGSVKLMDLLNEAQQKALEQLRSREKEAHDNAEKEEEDKDQFARGTNLDSDEFEKAAEKLGMASIKYYDLKQNRVTNYEFSYKKMLDPKGNTAVYLVYAYVRMCSILRKSGIEP
jgi:arginyl-tRNA synthetase